MAEWLQGCLIHWNELENVKDLHWMIPKKPDQIDWNFEIFSFFLNFCTNLKPISQFKQAIHYEQN